MLSVYFCHDGSINTHTRVELEWRVEVGGGGCELTKKYIVRYRYEIKIKRAEQRNVDTLRVSKSNPWLNI